MYICNMIGKIFQAVLTAILLTILQSCAGTGQEDTSLATLDELVAQDRNASKAAIATADSAARAAATLAGTPGEFDAQLDAAEAFSDIDLHKALEHTLSALRVSRAPGASPDSYTRARLRLASLYNSQGYMTKESCEIFESLDTALMDTPTREQYYVLGVQLYNSLARRSIDSNLSARYRRLASAYRDSVLAISPDRVAIAANRYLTSGHSDSALYLLRARLPDSPSLSPEAASVYYHLAQVYITRNERDSAIRYLTLSALSDLSRGSRNYRSLPRLALLLLERGDVDRAYRYIHRSSDDAAGSHASKRQIEMAEYLPSIDAAYADARRRHNLLVAGASPLAAVVAAVVIIAFILLRRKNRQLREGAEALSRSHEQLRAAYVSMESLNRRIAEESRVKEQYITSFMELCLSYLKKMESFRAELAKIAAQGDLKAVTKAINSSRYVNREIAEFYDNFDRAFLSLYPGFIGSLNSLLRPEEHYAATLSFSTELRIYALIWLGINESGEIARFLRCSESTVYNYRTQMRNRAMERDSFEGQFSALSGHDKPA